MYGTRSATHGDGLAAARLWRTRRAEHGEGCGTLLIRGRMKKRWLSGRLSKCGSSAAYLSTRPARRYGLPQDCLRQASATGMEVGRYRYTSTIGAPRREIDVSVHRRLRASQHTAAAVQDGRADPCSAEQKADRIPPAHNQG